MRYSRFYVSISLAALALLVFAPQSLFAQVKVGFVNTQRIMEEYKEAVEATTQLDELYADWEGRARQMQRELQKKQERFSDRVLVWSDATKRDKQREIQELFEKLQQFQQDKFGQDGEASDKENELMAPVRRKIQRAIRDVADAEDFNYIFEISSGSDLLYASDDQPDLTDRVIRTLNNDY